ncbi:hypothetical protein AB0G02_22150 [Actinosynnema sp. NPDC023658]|uniref:DUF1700 domain-containing protein n=1 Tax=Actinosynnema sp. NPDC023658 TaxID=3155465 RepID=UPI0033C2DEA9
MNTQTNTEVQHYLDAMREALSDLPAAEVAEIVDDAGAHVVEVAEEMGDEFTLAALTDRLGTPRAYADELRAAAGYPTPSAPASGRSSLVARFTLWSLVAGVVMAFGFAVSRGEVEELTLLVGLCATVAAVLVFRQKGLLAEVAALPETIAITDALARVQPPDVQKALATLRIFQPVWWIARALLIGAGGLVLMYRLPPVVLLAIALALLSLPAGVKAKTDRRWLWVSLPATAFALGMLLFIFGTLATRFDHYPVSSTAVSTYNGPPASDNIYVFDKDGKPLTDVYLYDEDGRPLDSSWYGCTGRDRDDNRYPRPRVVHDEQGCHEEGGVPFTVVMPTVPTTTAPSGTSPSGTSTAVPTTTAPPATPSSVVPSAPTVVTTTG